MYPITPATSASHYLSEIFAKVGGVVHQAEDEIAACDVRHRRVLRRQVRRDDHLRPRLLAQAGGHRPRGDGRDPAGRGQRAARRAEHRPADQGRAGRPARRDLRQPRRRAEGGHGGRARSRTASTRSSPPGASPRRSTWSSSCCPTRAWPPRSSPSGARSSTRRGWRRPVDQSPVPEGLEPYDWDATTGLSRRFIPGQPGGMHTAHRPGARHREPRRLRPGHQRAGPARAQPQAGGAAEDAASRRRCSAATTGDLLVIGWGSTQGAIEEAVERLRGEGRKVSSMHLRFLQPDAAGDQGDHAALRPGDDHRGELERPSRATRSSTRPTAATPPWRCCCARATSSTSTAGARCGGQPIKPGTRAAGHSTEAGPAMIDLTRPHRASACSACTTSASSSRTTRAACRAGAPGCGDNAMLAAVQRLCRDEGLRPEKTVFVSGIGCSSRLPHYMNTYGFHGIHGRALPVAEGIQMARPDLNVFVNTGRRRLVQHRRGALDPRHPLQHEHDRDAARQPDLRPDQEAGVAHLAAGHEDQHHAARLATWRRSTRSP